MDLNSTIQPTPTVRATETASSPPWISSVTFSKQTLKLVQQLIETIINLKIAQLPWRFLGLSIIIKWADPQMTYKTLITMWDNVSYQGSVTYFPPTRALSAYLQLWRNQDIMPEKVTMHVWLGNWMTVQLPLLPAHQNYPGAGDPMAETPTAGRRSNQTK